uniref:D-aminoacyl-tRNA deacylase n=1 Tax=Echinostoma caproni TaxID=27848 RepID=A0A183BAP9_9TREM
LFARCKVNFARLKTWSVSTAVAQYERQSILSSVNGSIVSQIRRGVLVLIGISSKDEKQDIAYIVRKILNLRLFPNADGSRRWDKSVKDLGLEILCVSQFTLYSELKGNKLDFHRAMDPELSEKVYASVVQQIRENYVPERVKGTVRFSVSGNTS